MQNIKQFAKQCRRFYAHNKVMLNQIDQFLSSSNGYSSSIAINYYTRDLFFYRRINQALRQQNFQAILDFRFFLIDMQAQLQKAYFEFAAFHEIDDIMIFYRGQRMSKEEMEALQEKRLTGSLITVNSYLSTSFSRNLALHYVHNSLNDELIPVIYKIKAKFKDPNINRRKPFAYIGHLSQYGGEEQEVLFSVGSFFRVDEIEFNKEENMHFIQLTFIYDEDHYIITDDYGALKTCSVEEKIFKTGDLLFNHTKHGAIKAFTFYQHFLSDDYSTLIKAACHTGLGWLAFKQKQFDSAILYQEKALKMYESFNNENCLDYLYVTTYNCIGAVYKQQGTYPKALLYYRKAYKKNYTVIPVDKYAFYHVFNNIVLINIACIYKIQGHIEQAWSSYKNILANQMNKSTHFHSATYLKIAEAGFSEGLLSSDSNAQMEQMNNWKRFLDFSLTDMSSSYRRSIVSGALSIGLKFANNEQSWDNAIDYYKQIIQISRKYVSISSDDYYIVIKCHQQIAEIYRKKHNYVTSIKYASDGLNLCQMNDLEFYTIFYETMATTYEQQFQQWNLNLSPDDIDSKISLDLPTSPSSSYAHRTIIVLNFERNEFSFGQYKKSLNSNLLKESNLKRCLVYCLLKVAALKHEQGKTDNIRELIYRVRAQIPDEEQIQFVCENNLAYLDNKFDEIIHNYENSLTKRDNNTQTLCIGEDAFCYIAHLYGQKNETDTERQWYLKGITYFEENKFVCEHTQSSFVKTISFYHAKKDMPSCVSTYLKLIHHLTKYRAGTFQLQRQIAGIVEYILQQLKADDEEQLFILKHLVQLVSRQSEDINLVHTDFQWIIDRYRKNNKQSWLAAHAYESYLDYVLQHIIRPLTSYIEMILPAFRQIITVYKLRDDSTGALNTYQHIINVILKYSTNRDHIISIFKKVGLDLEQKGLTKPALDIYEALRQFIYAHPAQIIFHDDNLIYYILARHQILAEHDKESAVPIYRTMIHILRSYQEECHSGFQLKDYLRLLELYYMALALIDPASALELYYNLLDTFLRFCSKDFDALLAKIVNAMRDRPVELLELLTKYRIDYIQLIQRAKERLSHPTDQSIMCKSFPLTRSSNINDTMSSYVKKAKRCFAASKIENSIIECWTNCIIFLLEFCSQNDDYVASCYIQLADPVKAANVFNHDVYCNLALQYCPNACRRYLKYVYPQTDMREEIELRFADHFYLVDSKKEIRPLGPVNY